MRPNNPTTSTHVIQKMANSVFVYGSLMAPPVVQELVGRLPPSIPHPVRLWGHSRHPVKNQAFPAVIPAATANSNQQQGSFVDGMIWCELSDWEMKVLDFFEDVEYQRTKVQVEPLSQQQQSSSSEDDATTKKTLLEVDAYVWANPQSELELDKDWNFEQFSSQRLEEYLQNTVRPYRAEFDRLEKEEQK